MKEGSSIKETFPSTIDNQYEHTGKVSSLKQKTKNENKTKPTSFPSKMTLEVTVELVSSTKPTNSSQGKGQKKLKWKWSTATRKKSWKVKGTKYWYILQHDEPQTHHTNKPESKDDTLYDSIYMKYQEQIHRERNHINDGLGLGVEAGIHS